MTVAVAVLALGLAVALLSVLVRERRVGPRLLAAAVRLDPEITAHGSSLVALTNAVERAIAGSLQRDDDVAVSERRLARALNAIPQGVLIYGDAGELAFRNAVAAGLPHLAPRRSPGRGGHRGARGRGSGRR